jgi:threonine/homoserine/homoserine lactone efflux protein
VPVADWPLIATGVGIGVAVAAPIGPVNIMCIHRAVRSGFLAGLASGLGAMVADGAFAAVAAFGITAIAGFVEGHVTLVKLVGGIVLMLFAAFVALRRPPATAGEDELSDSRLSGLGAGITAFVMAITNPGLLLGFLGIFGGLGDFATRGGGADAVFLVIGVTCGSLLWWVTLAGVVSHFRRRFNETWLRGFNLAAGGALALFGAAILVDAAIEPFL